MKRARRVLLSAIAIVLAGYVTWDRAETYRLDRDIAAIAARGEPIDLAAAEPAPSTVAEQEAARLYAEAAARARQMTQEDGRLTRVDVDGVVGRVDLAELESTFRMDASALQLLDGATALPFAGFGDAIDGPDGTSSAGLQALSALACLRADLLAYHGRGDEAAASLAAAVGVQRTLPDLFGRSFLASRQFGSLRILLRHAAPSAAALESLQHAFAGLSDDDLIVHDLMLYRAHLIEWRGNVLGQDGLPWVAAVVLHPFLIRAERLQIEQFPEAMLAARTPWPGKLGALAALAESPANRDRRTSLRRTIFGPPLNLAALSSASASSRAASSLAIRRLAVVALAIERYRRANAGSPPPDLAALVPAFLPAVPIDPFSGAPPIYKPSASDYLLYSLDANRKDDGGQIYGIGSLNPMPLPRARDLGIRVPLTPHRGAE